ncbi:3-phosphoserine/phosphohydroxythreonine transaminase [Pigmentiphaga sp.]|uniref:3-phosphoserine/phosphohydroxythreonine transaminase n=1 Tax=Pigmentiphaga sp. TaxID=1977564 RepID=UPI00128D5E1C|nr:3-phosphoserine/phosphohydroxythreonine transaminase [Pigmentiphaga sp.]MPS28801.1 3-phosphoserine/phosphohydroxythreonine transaminase [Alcaligenaceae bacterium SAGV5]MPS52570.1 3-phosphoserine/phosphohydroxythreonine transaminase [Alcaligenaceae bacterium SAGV3]MPT60347.1 3-phosphoserine/phosphohydroxythreonine transaminase [Alcaligenaceae bacterium]
MNRPYNFSAGPAVLPEAVLQQAAAEMLDWHGSGMSVMEMSHRGKHFEQICDEAEADLRELLSVPDGYAVLFLQGGGLGENAIAPMNLIGRREAHAADYVVSGSWSVKSCAEARRYGDVAVAATSEQSAVVDGAQQGPWTYMPDPASWRVRPQASYVHLCSNETIGGVEFMDWPDLAALGAPEAALTVDASSHILSRPMDVSRAGLIYAGAQKNIGPAGLTIVIVRKDLLGQALPICPSAFDYTIVAKERSRFNTPPTYAIYIAGLVFKWLKQRGGVAAMEAANVAKAGLLYDYLDSTAFYRNPVHRPVRSRMNVPFMLRDDALNAPFLQAAEAAQLLQLKGHKSVGGMRASIYNAMSIEGVRALVDFMKDFERSHG